MTSNNDQAMITAETAMVLPAIVASAAFLLNVIGLGIAHVELVDASREAARMIARGDDEDSAFAQAKGLAPVRTKFSTSTSQGFTTVTATANIDVLGGIFSVELDATAVTTTETP